MPAAGEEAERGRDMLLGVIALQLNFIDRAQFVEVTTLLPSQTGKRAEDLFAQKGYIDAKRIGLLRGPAR